MKLSWSDFQLMLFSEQNKIKTQSGKEHTWYVFCKKEVKIRNMDIYLVIITRRNTRRTNHKAMKFIHTRNGVGMG